MKWLALMALLFCQTGYAQGSSGAAGPGGFHASAAAMVLTSSTKQGGQGPEGSTILTHSELMYSKSWWGFGIYFQYDKHGDSETDTGIGPKLELAYQPFYFELGYTFNVARSFTDRSIANQTGDGMLLGVGVRFALASGGGKTGGMYFQASYKYRTQKLGKQDGVSLDEPIEQTDGYPVFGLGYRF